MSRYFYFLLVLALPFLTLPCQAQTSQWIWVQQMQARNASIGAAVAVNPDGNIIVAGNAFELTVFGTDTVSGMCSFIARYDSANGDLLWHRILTPSQSPDPGAYEMVFISDMALDAAGNINIVGLFSDSLILDSVILVSMGANDIFTASFTPTGQLRWAKSAGAAVPSWADLTYVSDQAYGLAVSPNGWVFISGMAKYQLVFDGQIFPTNNYVSNDFLACYDSTGQFQWMSYGMGGPTRGIEAVEGNYLYQSEVVDGVQSVGKYNMAGSLVGSFPIAAPGSSTIHVEGIVFDADRNCYLTGYFSGHATFGSSNYGGVWGSFVVLKFDNTGQLLWHHALPGSVTYGRALAVDPEGNVFVTGKLTGANNFGPGHQLPPAQKSDIFVACYNSSGTLLWVNQVGGPGNDDVNDIVAPAKGTAYLTGWYARPATFGTHVVTGNTTTYDDGFNYFLARITGSTLTGLAWEQSQAEQLLLFPNPTANVLHLQAPALAGTGNGTLRLYNSIGQLALEQAVSNGAEAVSVQVAHLPAGLYFVKLQTATTHKLAKFVKQ